MLTMTDLLTVANVGRVVVVAAIAIGAVWADRAVTGREAPRSDSMRVEMVHRTMELGDLQEPTEPEVVKVYRAPDSQDTHDDQITLPLWLDTLTTRGGRVAGRQDFDLKRSDSSEVRQSGPLGDSLPTSTPIAGLPYAIIPLTRGRPSLSVGSRRVTLSAIDPRTGAGLEYAWDVPEPTWSADWASTATAGLDAATLTSALYATRHSGWGSLSIGPAGQVVITQDGYSAGAALSIRYETTLWSR